MKLVFVPSAVRPPQIWPSRKRVNMKRLKKKLYCIWESRSYSLLRRFGRQCDFGGLCIIYTLTSNRNKGITFHAKGFVSSEFRKNDDDVFERNSIGALLTSNSSPVQLYRVHRVADIKCLPYDRLCNHVDSISICISESGSESLPIYFAFTLSLFWWRFSQEGSLRRSASFRWVINIFASSST